MIVPSTWLIVIVAGVCFPAAIAGALLPGLRWIAIVPLAVVGGVAIVDAALRRRALQGIRIELPNVARFFKDRDAEVMVRVHNPTKLARRLRIGIVAPDGVETPDEERVVILPEGAETVEFAWPWKPMRRGRYRIDACYVEGDSILKLWKIRRRESAALEIRVYPNLRRDDDLKALRRDVDGMHTLRQVGRGREFEKLREYVAGDGFDEIHWKATARRGRPITKVFQVERTQEVYAIIDASRLAARPLENETALDRAVAASLVLGAAAERRGDLFGLAAFSNQVEAFIRARNGKTHYAACRDAIYELQPRPVSPDFDEIATFLRLRLRRRSLLLFLTSLDDPVLAESFTRATKLLARRHLVLVGMIRPHAARPLFHDARVESSEDIYRQLAGHLSWKHLREVEAALGRQGIRLAMLEPQRFGSGLVGLYDEVKQRQLL